VRQIVSRRTPKPLEIRNVPPDACNLEPKFGAN
jgi:hypothetical protein